LKKINKISVITVCLNSAGTIASTLDNVASQTFKNVEHILIDGGSTDGTVDIINKYGVTYFVSEPDNGIYDAMEKGVKASSGDIMIFLNSGDLFYDDKVCEDVVEFFNKTDSDIIFGDFQPYLINQSDKYDHDSFKPDKVCKLDMIKNRGYLKKNNIHHQALFYRREVFDKCSFVSSHWPQGSDYILNAQALLIYSFRAKYFPRIISKFALGGKSTSNYQREINDYKKLSTIISENYFSIPGTYDENEYVFDAERKYFSTLRNNIIQSKPYIFVRTLLIRFIKQIAKILQMLLFKLEPASNIINDFQKRTDSIYNVINENKLRLDKIDSKVQKIDSESYTSRASYQKLIDELQKCINKQLAQQSIDIKNHLVENYKIIFEAIRTLQKLNKTTNINIGKLLNEKLKENNDIKMVGYKITSQFDEDGIIQYLLSNIDLEKKIFIEFGVENYTESNTRYLMEKDNWAGLIIDQDYQNIEQIKNYDIYWKHNLQAICAFINRENINDLFINAGIKGDIGILSIDIDGIDYWVWEAIKIVSPRIVICEYNSIFGCVASVTVPYDPNFNRKQKHYSLLYAGASLSALAELGKQKGYALVASNTAGNNAFFVRKDCMNNFTEKTVKQVYVKAQFRESRSIEGRLTYIPIEEGIKIIGELPVYDLQTRNEKKVKDIEIAYV